MVGQKLAVEVGHLFRSAFSECAGGGVDTIHFDFACFPIFAVDWVCVTPKQCMKLYSWRQRLLTAPEPRTCPLVFGRK